MAPENLLAKEECCMTGRKRVAMKLFVFWGMLILLMSTVPVSAAKLKLSETSIVLIKGQKQQLSVNTKKTIRWSSANTRVASVSKSGLVRAKAVGKTAVTAKVGKTSLKCVVKVEQPVLNTTSATLQTGETLKLKLKKTTQEVTWKSNRIKIAPVNEKGVVTAMKPGQAVITATVLGKKYKAAVTVEKKELSGLFGATKKVLEKEVPTLKVYEKEDNYMEYQDGEYLMIDLRKVDGKLTVQSIQLFKEGLYTVFGCDLGMTKKACLKSIRKYTDDEIKDNGSFIMIGKPNGKFGMTEMDFEDGKLEYVRLSSFWAE